MSKFHRKKDLRDEFAKAALIGMGTWTPCDPDGKAAADIFKAKAEWAYKMADAMLEERRIGFEWC